MGVNYSKPFSFSTYNNMDETLSVRNFLNSTNDKYASNIYNSINTLLISEHNKEPSRKTLSIDKISINKLLFNPETCCPNNSDQCTNDEYQSFTKSCDELKIMPENNSTNTSNELTTHVDSLILKAEIRNIEYNCRKKITEELETLTLSDVNKVAKLFNVKTGTSLTSYNSDLSMIELNEENNKIKKEVAENIGNLIKASVTNDLNLYFTEDYINNLIRPDTLGDKQYMKTCGSYRKSSMSDSMNCVIFPSLFFTLQRSNILNALILILERNKDIQKLITHRKQVIINYKNNITNRIYLIIIIMILLILCSSCCCTLSFYFSQK